MTTVTVHAAKTHLSRLIQRAAAGEEIVIVRGKTPVARLIAIPQQPVKRQFADLEDEVAARLAAETEDLAAHLGDQRLPLPVQCRGRQATGESRIAPGIVEAFGGRHG